MPKDDVGMDLRFGVDPELKRLLLACKELNSESHVTETSRRLLRKAALAEIAENSLDAITPVIRRVMKEELKVTENRLASITAKTSIAAATSMYLNYQVLGLVGIENPKALYEAARKKAVGFTRVPLDELHTEVMDENKRTLEEIL